MIVYIGTPIRRDPNSKGTTKTGDAKGMRAAALVETPVPRTERIYTTYNAVWGLERKIVFSFVTQTISSMVATP